MLAPTLLNLSALCEQRGDRAEARAFAQRAADVLDGAVTADHPHRIAAPSSGSPSSRPATDG